MKSAAAQDEWGRAGWTGGGFTLIELLASMAIIAILVGIAIPAIKGLGGSSRLDTIGNRLTDLTSLARQNSLAKNCLTALVLLTSTQPGGTRQATAVFQLLPRVDGTPTAPADWKQLTAWDTLAPGICVDVAPPQAATPASNAACTFQDAASQDPASPTSLPSSFQYEGATVDKYKFVIFLAGGGLLNGNAARVQLVEGTLPPAAANSLPPAAIYIHPIANSSNPVLPANYYRITLVAATGRAKIDRP